jgi:alpha-tubulin suppressor-like RCC1 family protein
MNKQKVFKLAVLAALLGAQFAFVQSPAQALLPVNIAPISAGAASTCAIRASDDLYCVGGNSFGQLGNGTKVSTSDPQKVIGLGNVSVVSVGSTSACAVTSGGLVFCWGDNTSAQLGLGNTDSKNVATQVPGLVDMVNVAVGSNFACSLSNSGSLYCWGANESGQLGNDSKITSLIPTPVTAAPSGINSLTVNGKRVCVLTTEVYCWGDFASFVFPNENRNWLPTKLTGSLGAASISLGSDFGCINFSSTVSCWGANDHGQLGSGTKINSSTLVTVTGLANITRVSAGGHFACALDVNKETYCWGENANGQLGITPGPDQPTRIPTGASPAVFIASGANSFCSLKLSGVVSCVGDSSAGQSGSLSVSASPLSNSLVSNLIKVSSGSETTCAIDTTGVLKCWGSLKPVSTTGNTFSDVSVGNASACAIAANKKILCWGSNSSGQLGDNTNRTSESLVQVFNSTTSFLQVAVGYKHACAVTSEGLVYCWGDNSHLQLGATGDDSKVPKVVPGIASATSVAVGDYHSCAQQTEGGIICWGDNSKKQVNSSSTKYMLPTSLALPSPVSKFSLGAYNTCLLLATTALQCFGDNSKKQSPGTVTGSYSSVSSGSSTVCAITIEKKVSCFGSADSSKLGEVSLNSSTPIQIATLSANSVSVGDVHACVVTADGTLSCWGANGAGQLASSFGFPAAFADSVALVTGTLAVGESLTARASGGETKTTFSYLWKRALQRDGSYSSLSSQTSATMSLAQTDLGRFFVVEVKQTKWGITSAAYTSAPFGPVAEPIRLLLTPVPNVSGMNKVGRILTARPGSWDSGVKFSYQWYRGRTAIKGAAKATYKLVAADVGKQIFVTVIGTKGNLQSVSMKSAKTSKIVR